MAVEITCRTSDSVDDPVVKLTAAHIEVSGLDPWTAEPTQDDPSNTVQNRFRLVAEAPEGDDGMSHEFTPSAEGDHVWDGYVFPVAGSWTLHCYQLDEDGALDSSVGNLAVTVVEDE